MRWLLRRLLLLVVVSVTVLLGLRYTFAATSTAFTVVQNADALNLDPWNTSDNPGLGIVRAFYDRMFEFSPTMKVQESGLVTSWSVSSDGLIYTFKLRSGVGFRMAPRLMRKR